MEKIPKFDKRCRAWKKSKINERKAYIYSGLQNSDIPFVFIIDFFEKKTRQIFETKKSLNCSMYAFKHAFHQYILQFDKFFGLPAHHYSQNLQKIKTSKTFQIPACHVQKLFNHYCKSYDIEQQNKINSVQFLSVFL